MKQFIMNVLYHLVPNKVIFWKKLCCTQKIALTFDDGPDPETTPKMLSALAKIDAKATFFVTGLNVQKYPEVLLQVASAGHEIANHGYSHESMKEISLKKLHHEVNENDKILNALGTSSRLFRPPYGHINLLYLPLLLAMRKTIVMWSLDCKDYKADSSQQIVNSFKEKRLSGGEVLLFHDTSEVTPEAILEIGDICKGRGFKIVSVSELLNC